jgi:23S rRNA-/tRNA-specific pseudouridylate synthase
MKSCLLFSASAAASAFGFHHANERSLLLGLKKVGRYYRQQHVKNQWREPSEQRVLLFQRKKTSQPFGSADNQSLLFGKGGGVVEVDDETETPIVVINGTAPGLIVTDVYRVPLEGFLDDANIGEGSDSITLSKLFSTEDITRLRLVSQNVTLPAALMMLDPGKYPTQSRARKAIRQRSICICRRRRRDDENDETTHEFDEMGKVIARIYPGDVIGFQRRAGSDYIAIEGAPYRLPAFEVPVIFEDDHMAIVNKPAGVVVYRAEGGRGGGARAGGHGRDTLMSALSFVLMPSNFTDDDENVPLKRPHAVHRLDRPTSGLMVVAKTKAAAVHLAQQFEFRKAKKTYMAIVNGSPISHENEESSSDWNIIDHDLDEKSALTKWRQIQKVDSLRGRNGQLTLVELKPKTGV